MSLTCGYVMGLRRLSLSFSIVSLSSLRSSLVPTRMMGVLGQWWLTSGYHFVRTFSYEAGLTNEKQMRNTSWQKNNSKTRNQQKQVKNVNMCNYHQKQVLIVIII